MPGSLSKQALLLAGSRALGQVLNAVAGLLVVRALAQFDYGTYRQLFLLYASFYLIGDFAFAQSLYHFVPRARDRAHVYYSQALLAALVFSLAWSAAFLLFAQPLGGYFENPDLPRHMALLGAWLTLNLLAKIPETALITLERTAESSFNIAAFEGLRFVFVVGAILAGSGMDGILWAIIAASALRLAFLAVLLRGLLRWELGAFAEQFRYAMSLWLPGLMNNSSVYAHQYIVGHYFAPADYAIYAVACFQIPLMGVLGTSVGEVFLVRATHFAETGRTDEICRLWLEACRKSLLVYIPAAVAFAVLAEPLMVALFTPAYRASAPLFVFIVASLPFQGMFQDSVFRAFHAMRAYSFFYFLRVVLSIGLGVAGAKWWGMQGAAVSTLLALAILNAAQLAYVARLLQVAYAGVLPWGSILRAVGVSAVAAVPAYLAARWLAWPPLALGTGLAGFVALYVPLGIGSGLVTREDLMPLTEMRKTLRG